MATRKAKSGAAVLWGVLLVAAPVFAQEASSPDPEKILSSLHFKTGEVALGGGVAKVALPAGYGYLDPADSKKVIVDLWGNPPEVADCLGIVAPTSVSLADPGHWAVVFDWSEEGYVKDDDAEKINFDDLLKQMQAAVKEHNAERVKQGYDPVELLGWAVAPRYDRASHKLYWAKKLKFGDSEHVTLNYCIRALGRRGVLEMNVVGSLDQLDDIVRATPELLGMVDFLQGQRYVDFNPSTDKVAAYGLAALVAGAVAAKAGLLKGLWLLILAAKKFIIIGAIALVAFFRKAIGRIFTRSQGPTTMPPPS